MLVSLNNIQPRIKENAIQLLAFYHCHIDLIMVSIIYPYNSRRCSDEYDSSTSLCGFLIASSATLALNSE
jgi:hypothetical protein